MGFFRSLKGEKRPDVTGDSGGGDASSTGNTGTDSAASSSEKRRQLFHRPDRDASSQSTSQTQSSEYQPPAGLPSSQPVSNPPPYHDWTAIPDTALLPPPPSINHITSPTSNASYSAAERAHAWCDRNPVYTPSIPAPAVHAAAQNGSAALDAPHEYTGTLTQRAPGVWASKSAPACPDAILLSNIPLYFTAVDSPLQTQRSKTIYFEVRVLRLPSRAADDASLALGYAAKPYPSWRLPGWHRASVGVHGDDGRRFVNDSWGGVDFVRRFEEGDVVGIGMRFRIPTDASNGGGGSVRLAATAKTQVFFTRNGRQEGWWEVDEERDAERDEGVEGLQGELDMYAAVGVFGAVEFAVLFRQDSWKYRDAES